MAKRIGYKVYVKTRVRCTMDGQIIPLSFEWEDGTVYEITSVKNVEQKANLRAGGAGTCYTCMVNGKQIHLFLEDSPSGKKWFLESKV